MALLVLGPWPALSANTHRAWLPWLEHRCFDRACAYCLEQARVLEVDHVVPESLAPDRARDPSNLLPACGTCNGPTGKWDYHPDRSPRRKCPSDQHGWLALDPRQDDLAALYELAEDGGLDVRAGPGQLRALWNRDVLFRLNRPKLKRWRQHTVELAEVAEHLVVQAREAADDVRAEALRRRDVIVGELARRLLFFELLEIPLSPGLYAMACALRDAERGPVVGLEDRHPDRAGSP